MRGSGTPATPVADFLESFVVGLFEQADAVPGMLKFVNIGPHFRAPSLVVQSHFSAGGAAGVQFAIRRGGFDVAGQLDEYAADFLDVIICIYQMFVAQEVSETQLVGFGLSFGAGVKGSIFGSQLLGRVTSHPESFFMRHRSMPGNKPEDPGRGNSRLQGLVWLKQLRCRRLASKWLWEGHF